MEVEGYGLELVAKQSVKILTNDCCGLRAIPQASGNYHTNLNLSRC
jgi:hypothetical protein